jgi:hypothetical protein
MTYIDSSKPRHYTELRPVRAAAMAREINEIEQTAMDAAREHQQCQREEQRELRRGSIAGLRAEMHAEIGAVREQFDGAIGEQTDATVVLAERIADRLDAIERKFERRFDKIEARMQVLQDHRAAETERVLADLRQRSTAERERIANEAIAVVLWQLDEKLAPIAQRVGKVEHAIERPAGSERALDELRARHAAEIANVMTRCREYFDQRVAEIEHRNERERDVYATVIEQMLRGANTCVRLPRNRGTYDRDARYEQLDVTVKDGAGWLAVKNDPGEPGDGDGWQLLSMRGQRGVAGERGERGPPGLSAVVPRLSEWQINVASFTAIPRYSDGSCGPELDLKPLFERFLRETGG